MTSAPKSPRMFQIIRRRTGFGFGFELFTLAAALPLRDFVFDFCAIQMPFLDKYLCVS
jgi:hypothetical protein